MNDLDKAGVIKRAHELAMHDDGYFHEECPQCVEVALVAYLNECSMIVCDLGNREEFTDVGQAFNAYMRSLPPETLTWVFHDEPVYTIAGFLGIHKLGDELEADPLFKIIEAAAAPLRQRRLANR